MDIDNYDITKESRKDSATELRKSREKQLSQFCPIAQKKWNPKCEFYVEGYVYKHISPYYPLTYGVDPARCDFLLLQRSR